MQVSHARLAARFGAAALALLLASGAQAHGRGRHLPQLSPATPAALVGTCESLVDRLGGLAIPPSPPPPPSPPAPSWSPAAGRPSIAASAGTCSAHQPGGRQDLLDPVRDAPARWPGTAASSTRATAASTGAWSPANTSFGGGPLTSALLQGFAVLSSDAGHSNAQGGPAFGLDPQARLDYGYQAVGKLTPMAKQADRDWPTARGPTARTSAAAPTAGATRWWPRRATRSDYDGYLAGAPGYNLPLAALANIFGAQRYATVATGDPATPPGLETPSPPAERKTVADAVLARCDALDGAATAWCRTPDACQRAFDLDARRAHLRRRARRQLPDAAQKVAIAPIFSGATTGNGEPLLRAASRTTAAWAAAASRSGNSPRRWCSTRARWA